MKLWLLGFACGVFAAQGAGAPPPRQGADSGALPAAPPPRSMSVSAALGVNAARLSGIADYVNVQYLLQTKADEFSTVPDFDGAVEIYPGPDWGLKFEYAYLLNSYNVPGSDIGVGIHLPTLIVHYVVRGEGFAVKFGGGPGYYVGHFSLEPSPTGQRSYSARGPGVKLEIEENSAFGEHLFSFIVLGVRGGFLGDLEDEKGNSLAIPFQGRNARMDFVALGVMFGLSYYL